MPLSNINPYQTAHALWHSLLGDHSPTRERTLEFGGVDLGHPTCSVGRPRRVPFRLVVCSDWRVRQLDSICLSGAHLCYGASKEKGYLVNSPTLDAARRRGRSAHAHA